MKSKGWRCAVERVIADENKRIGTASLVKGLDIDWSKVRMHVRQNGSKLNRVFVDFCSGFRDAANDVLRTIRTHIFKM